MIEEKRSGEGEGWSRKRERIMSGEKKLEMKVVRFEESESAESLEIRLDTPRSSASEWGEDILP